ncbi:hypothetical protein HYDPIDRAFT_115387 [Hydnomerulius pinastri MD-312]|uniref:Secreted protein n=1 Tax=Hydnomerulius pinastri MD-312 TaxID=994086 RepID=A0A0C9V879_9AGAM|nr:hypothetical protein HYDPIDRAFT_115387 [Hydnomerulius pinastri MD-312]
MCRLVSVITFIHPLLMVAGSAAVAPQPVLLVPRNARRILSFKAAFMVPSSILPPPNVILYRQTPTFFAIPTRRPIEYATPVLGGMATLTLSTDLVYIFKLKSHLLRESNRHLPYILGLLRSPGRTPTWACTSDSSPCSLLACTFLDS